MGINLQEALVKIKNDIKQDTRDTVENYEQRFLQKNSSISQDISTFRAKWDKEFYGFKNILSK